MNEEEQLKEIEEMLSESEKENLKVKPALSTLKKQLENLKPKKISELQRKTLQLILSSLDMNDSHSKMLSTIVRFTINSRRQLSSRFDLLVKLIRTVFYYALIMIFVVGYRKEIGNIAWNYTVFAFQNWPKLSLETRYGFLVIAPISGIVALIINKIFTGKKHNQ